MNADGDKTNTRAGTASKDRRSPRTKGTASGTVRADIDAGVCGFSTTVEADGTDMRDVRLTISTDCPYIARVTEELESLDMLEELKTGYGRGQVYETLSGCVRHVTCPVGSGILKAAEAAAGLALPRDVCVRLTTADDSGEEDPAGPASEDT